MASYDDIPEFGLLYDSVPMYAARGDVRFYGEEAAATKGRVLELGCGTGRILLPIARAGHTIVGLDGSEEMLVRCRANVAAEAKEVGARVTLHRGDVRDFDLGEKFDLVVAPFRVMQHIVTIDDQLRVLDAVSRHLTAGGRFIFDVFNPNFRILAAADGTEMEDTPEHLLPDGRTFRRTGRVAKVRWVEQVSEIELAYYVAAKPGAPPKKFVQGFDMRWYLRAELEHLMARAGFRVEAIYGDFDRSPVIDESREQVVCTRRA